MIAVFTVHLCSMNQKCFLSSLSKKGNVPTATVTAFYKKEGNCHFCELLLSQTEKAPELKAAVQDRVSLLKHSCTPGGYNHSKS